MTTLPILCTAVPAVHRPAKCNEHCKLHVILMEKSLSWCPLAADRRHGSAGPGGARGDPVTRMHDLLVLGGVGGTSGGLQGPGDARGARPVGRVRRSERQWQPAIAGDLRLRK